VPPALSAEEVVLGDSKEHGDGGGCTAESLVRIGVWSCKEAAVARLDAQIQPMAEELQRRRGRPLEAVEAGIAGEQWHEEAIKRAVVEQGWHFHKVKIDSTDAKAVDLMQALNTGNYLVTGVTNNCWYKGKKARIKYPDYPADAPATSAAGWVHSIAIIDGHVRDGGVDELLSSLWIRADNRPDPGKGYMRSIRKVWRVSKCSRPDSGCRGACVRS
jgi:hypothetical protein